MCCRGRHSEIVERAEGREGEKVWGCGVNGFAKAEQAGIALACMWTEM